MLRTHRPRGSSRPGGLTLLLALAAAAPAAASAQVERGPAWTVVPMVGFGFVVEENGSRNSGGLEAAVDLEYGDARWRGGAYGSWRGLGVSCSHACWEGGPAVAAGASRALGRLWLGGGVGTMKQRNEWLFVPYGRVSVDVAPVRLDLRVELPQDEGSRVYLPLLVGFPVPRGGP